MSDVFDVIYTAGMAYLGNPESALYRQPTPSAMSRGHTTYVGLNPNAPVIPNQGFARPGGVTMYAPQAPQVYVSTSSTATPAGVLQSLDLEAAAVPGRSGDAGASSSTGPASPAAASSNSQLPQQSEREKVETAETTLTNTKEKTPMCLINELARFNKVS